MTLSYLIGRRNAQNTPWTGERDALLTQLWAEGYSASAIAEQIMDVHVSRCAVIGRAHRLKLPARQARAPAKRKPRKQRSNGVPKPRKQRSNGVPKPRKQRSNGVPKPPPPPPRPQPPPPPNEPRMRRLKLFKLSPTSCRWPIGEGPFLFCGADKAEDGVYCAFHMRMARVRK